MTSKLQVTLPKALAERHGIRAGDQIDWQAAGESLRIVPRRARPSEPGYTSSHLGAGSRAIAPLSPMRFASVSSALVSRGVS